ncbi:EVE domain-containing protein [Parabacteroides bouchesdurhonensis]|uniref:EVE domain-containing protein n=1 Tax=Parabacteroides bouchesdurhonensis TaxID=1936995 RepID=UPI000E533F99|nr:EVE domain-containing protein [Parabacteroides bouchesdurhonensis]RHJ93606.1 hypothetical protein DW095_05705 [Bacteroides sp. AM07-16]
MKYYIDLFSPNTALAFSESDQTISGFRISRKTYIQNKRISIGDKFICYCTKIQRFIGVLEIMSEPFVDSTPIFTKEEDPFILRFHVKPIVWLPLEKGIPIHDDEVWNNLSITKELSKDSTKWTYMVFSSPRLWPLKDCKYLEKLLLQQKQDMKDYPFSEKDKKKIKSSKRVRISNEKEVIIEIPEEDNNDNKVINKTQEERESIQVQALLAEIGEKLGYKIWIPRSDRTRVLNKWKLQHKDTLLEELPLVFDGPTLKVIENIDVLWVKKHSIVRAFEVEGTTAIYSGILRMADLLSLQPMLDIKIHIVSSIERRDAVFEQINRPVFAFMEKGPLADLCTYIAYDSVKELRKEPHLEHMNDSIIDEYAEFSND